MLECHPIFCNLSKPRHNPIHRWTIARMVLLLNSGLQKFIEILSFIDSRSILVQFVFVFWLKNPGGVNDDFWSCFINLWIIGFSYIFYFSKFLLNTQKPIVFFTCANINPEPFWSNTVQFTGHFEVFSIIISIILKLKLILFKKKQIPNEMSQRNIFMKNFTNNVINKNSLTSFKTSFLMLTIFASFIIVTGKINKMLPMEVNEFPSYIYVYIFQLISPPLIGFSILGLFYARNGSLRQSLLHEINNYFDCHH